MELLLIILSACIPAIYLSWKLPEKWNFIPLIVICSIFLVFTSPLSLVILIISSVFQYYTIKKFHQINTVPILVIVQIVLFFTYFKLGYGEVLPFAGKVIPIGLSYYCFRQISYALDAYKHELPKHKFTEYLTYLFFLPTFIVGPINRFTPFLKDLRKRRWDEKKFTKGLQRIIYGLVKITFLGNYIFSHKFKILIDSLAHENLWLSTYLYILNFSANAYVQLAGFSEVAIGLSLLFGFNIIENFNKPYFAKNIVDFWNRWHISLSHWCRDYVYMPFLSLTRNTYISIGLSMLVLSLWHEISFRYILWGGLHILAISLWHLYEKSKFYAKTKSYPKFVSYLGIIFTGHFVALSFILVSEDNLEDSLKIYKLIFGL